MTHSAITPELLTRLGKLPPKAAQPFRQLMATSQLSEDVVNTVLDAGELAGESSRLIAFTAAYFSMRLANVPVHDVIAMSKSNRRRINLAWSPARWHTEHDKLSHLEALKRLSQENLTYDVSAFTRHLPKYFPGYIICTSRKLGMEGLRQRHCVAAYHDKLKAGTSAILAIFIERRRWTVELQPTKNPEAPLRIAQIRTRHNIIADEPVRTAIHALLGIAPPSAAASAPLYNRPHHYMENLRAVLPILRRYGIAFASVTFNGSGDDGAIDDIILSPNPDQAAIDNERITLLTRQSTYDDDHWSYANITTECSLTQALTAITDDYLEYTNVDWYNDCGGFGELQINVAEGTVSLDVSTRYEESTSEYSAEHDILTGNEL